MVERRAADRRVGHRRQLREAQVGVLDAQLRDLAELRRQVRPLGRVHERAHERGLAPAGRGRPARVGRVAVGEPVGALAHRAEHRVLLPAQARVVGAEHGEQVGGRLSALGVAGHVALAPREREGQVQPREQALDLLGEALVLHGELGVHRRPRRRHRAAAEEEPAQEGDEAAAALHQPPRHVHLHGELVREHAQLVEHLQVAPLVPEQDLVAQPDRGAVRGPQRGVHLQRLEQREQVAGDRRQRHGDAHAEVPPGHDVEHAGAEQQAGELRPPAVLRRGHHGHQFALDVCGEAHGPTSRGGRAPGRGARSRGGPRRSRAATGARTTLTPSARRRSSSTTTGRAPRRS